MSKKSWSRLPYLCLLSLLAFAPAIRAQDDEPAPEPETAFGVFGVGITDVTATSGRLVFTTSVPAQAQVTVKDGDTVVKQLPESKFGIIHSGVISGLAEGKAYTLEIEAKNEAGASVKVNGPAFTPKQVTARPSAWEGKTYFGVGHVDDMSPAKKLNVGMVRVEVTWEWLIPAKGEVNYVNRDKVIAQVKAIKAAGMEPLILLAYGADWDQKYTNNQLKWRNRTFGPPDNVSNWKFYARAVMKALKGMAKYYEVFNEPDAGYLADGKPTEREVAEATGKSLFAGNNNYWLGDRYVPLIMATREAADEIDPAIDVFAASWNHDYNGTRGDLIFGRGANNYIQQYSFHNYVSQPHSFAKWEDVTSLYFRSAQKVFDKYNAPKPIAVTEWGIMTFDNGLQPGDLSSRHDGQVFFIKSAFFYMMQERVTIAIVHQLGYNDAWSLVNKKEDGSYTYTPAFDTYAWICKTFNNKKYKRLPLTTDGDETVTAAAISLTDAKETYVAAWQDRTEDNRKANASQPAKKINLKLTGLPAGTYTRTKLDTVGAELGKDEIQIGADGWAWADTVPEATGAGESEVTLYKLTPK